MWSFCIGAALAERKLNDVPGIPNAHSELNVEDIKATVNVYAEALGGDAPARAAAYAAYYDEKVMSVTQSPPCCHGRCTSKAAASGPV